MINPSMNSITSQSINYLDEVNIIDEVNKQISNLRIELMSYTDKSYNILINHIIKLSLLINDSLPYSHCKSSKWVEEIPKGLLSIEQEDIKAIKSSFLVIISMLGTYTDILFSIENNSLRYSLELLISFAKCKRIFTKECIGDIAYRILYICSLRSYLYTLHQNTIDDLVSEDKENIILQRKYDIVQNKHNDKRLYEEKSIELDEHDMSISRISNHDGIKNNNDSSYSQIINKELQTQLPFDNKTRKKIQEVMTNPKEFMNYVSQLEDESSALNDYLNKETNHLVVNVYSSFSHLHHNYLYLIKKVIDDLDSNMSNIFNKALKERFLNIIFRSKTVTSFILENINISNDYIYFTNKDIYLERYIRIGSFLYDRINFTKAKYELIKKVSEKITSDLINNMKDFYIREKLDIQNDSIIPSMYHSIIFPLMYHSDDNRNHNILGITCDIGCDNLMKRLAHFIKSEKRVTSLDPNLPFIMFNYEIIKGHLIKIYIENDRQLLILRSLTSFIFHKPKIIILYANIKSWAVSRLLFYDNQFVDYFNRVFDDCLLMYFIGLYLISIGENQPYQDEINAYTFNDSKYLYDNIEMTSSALGEIGELFVNFFYFLVSLLRKVNQSVTKHKVLVVDLRTRDIQEDEIERAYKSNNTNGNYNDKEALYLKNFEDTKEDYFYYKYSIGKMRLLEKEAYRMLHFLLKDDMIKIAFGFINKIN